MGDLISPEQFAEKIKAKYPQYQNIPNSELTQRIVAKYPQYKEQISFGEQQNDLGKTVIVPQEGESFIDTMKRAAAHGKSVTQQDIDEEMATAPHKAFQVAGAALSPMLPTATVPQLIGGFAGGTLAGKGGSALAKSLGASQNVQDVAGDVASIPGAMVGAGLGSTVAANVTPKQVGQFAGGAGGAVAGKGVLSVPGAYYGAKGGGSLVEGVLGEGRANRPLADIFKSASTLDTEAKAARFDELQSWWKTRGGVLAGERPDGPIKAPAPTPSVPEQGGVFQSEPEKIAPIETPAPKTTPQAKAVKAKIPATREVSPSSEAYAQEPVPEGTKLFGADEDMTSELQKMMDALTKIKANGKVQ